MHLGDKSINYQGHQSRLNATHKQHAPVCWWLLETRWNWDLTACISEPKLSSARIRRAGGEHHLANLKYLMCQTWVGGMVSDWDTIDSICTCSREAQISAFHPNFQEILQQITTFSSLNQIHAGRQTRSIWLTSRIRTFAVARENEKENLLGWKNLSCF